ncbi:hypothetical protein ACB092_05G077200 [Castanea dentata]
MASKAQKLKLGFICLVLFLGPSSQSLQDTLEQGQELKNWSELVSAQGFFRLGFFSLTSGSSYLGIWYNNVARREDNLVWLANRDNPGLDNSGSLTIDDHGNLKISYNGSLSIVLYSGQETSNASAVLLDTGNFVLSERSSGRQLWQSFDYPTDTLLPGMKVGVNHKTGHTWSLRSWRDVGDPDTGAFTFGLHPNHTNQLVILWLENIYWTSGSWEDNYFHSAIGLRNSYRNFSYTSNENETYFEYSRENYTVGSPPKLKIDYSGILSDNSSTLFNCTFASTDFNEGCAAKLPECRSLNDRFPLNILFGRSANGYVLKFNEGDNLSLVDCEAKCFNNCSCVAYAFANETARTGCEIWSTVPEDGPTDGTSRTTYNLYREEDRPATWDGTTDVRTNKWRANKWWIWLIVAVGGIIITLLCLLCYAKVKEHIAEGERKKKQKMLLQELRGSAIPSTVRDKVKKQNNDRQGSHDLQIFSFETISAATRNFSTRNKLGEGGFGPVYKGKLYDGQKIAIKRLSRSSRQGLVEFKNEAILIAKLQHTNLVRLLGFCIQQEEKILIYEYMPNKSLDFFLFDSTKKSLLNWKKRFNIIEGIAQGLLYLHKYSRLRVIHRDLKASNILLDEDMNPKISDFGLARILGLKGLEENTNRIVGTYGYMSPEYAMNGVVSIKIDVFSYGVLLLEIVSSKKNNSCYHSEYPLNLIGYAWQLWNEGKGLELIDPTIIDESCPSSEILRCIHVGLLCVQDQATDRPTMLDVATMLSSETVQLLPPKQPAYLINIVQENSSEVSEIKLENCSINNVTISKMEAR